MFHGELRGMAGDSGDAAGIKAGNRPETLRPGVPQTAGRQQDGEDARPNGDFLLYKNPPPFQPPDRISGNVPGGLVEIPSYASG